MILFLIHFVNLLDYFFIFIKSLKITMNNSIFIVVYKRKPSIININRRVITIDLEIC